MSRRRAERADPIAYRPPPRLTLAERTAEQDAAAGGHHLRLIARQDGSAVVASVALRCFPKSRRVYAYLRWTALDSGTSERYLGDVSEHPDRTSALAAAWRHARDTAPDHYGLAIRQPART
jgi:DNA mismatch endonuclease (patch repair protein)